MLFIRKPDYASFGYVTIPLHSLVTSNLRHLDVVSAKTGLSQCGLDPVFVLKLVPLAPSEDKRRSWPTNSHGNSRVLRKSTSVNFR